MTNTYKTVAGSGEGVGAKGAYAPSPLSWADHSKYYYMNSLIEFIQVKSLIH